MATEDHIDTKGSRPGSSRLRAHLHRARLYCTSLPTWGALSIIIAIIGASMFFSGFSQVTNAFGKVVDVGSVSQTTYLLTNTFATSSLVVQIVAVCFIFFDKLRIRGIACCNNPALGGVAAANSSRRDRAIACACYSGGLLIPMALWVIICLGLVATVLVSLFVAFCVLIASLCKFGRDGWNSFYDNVYQSNEAELVLSNIKQATPSAVASLDRSIQAIANHTCLADESLADDILSGSLLILLGVPLAVLAHMILLVSYTGAQTAVHTRLFESRKQEHNQ